MAKNMNESADLRSISRDVQGFIRSSNVLSGHETPGSGMTPAVAANTTDDWYFLFGGDYVLVCQDDK